MASSYNFERSSGNGPSKAGGFLIHEREYDNFQSFIDKDELNSGTVHGLNKYIAKSQTWKNKKLVVGITGNTGVGKSSLINALRGLKPKGKGAAAVGVTETTSVIRKYSYPQNDRVLLADFPGVGTNNFPKEDYMKKTELLNSDVVVIVTATRFTENDTWVAKNVLNAQKNVLFVRTKVDIDLSNAKEDDPDEFSENYCISTIRKEIEEKLNQEGIHNLRDVTFLVSTRHYNIYDFKLLAERLKCLLNVQGKAICSLLYRHMDKTIKLKTEQYAAAFLGRKIVSAVTGLLPIPKLESTLDTYHVSKIWETCLKGYCIDPDSLKQIATEVGESVEDLQSKLKSYEKDISDGEHLHAETEERTWSFLQKYSKYTIPVLGQLFSAYKSQATLQECLNTICRIMTDDEMMLVKLRLRKLEKDLSIV